MVKSYQYPFDGRSTIQLLHDLRLNYAVVSSGLILLGFFWNNLKGFDWQYVVLIVGFFFANVFGFVINDFYDATLDVTDNAKKTRNVFCSSTTKRFGKIVLLASLGLSLLFGWIISPKIFLIVILFNSLAFFYSAPPVKLRNRLYWDWIFVFLWKGLIIFTGYFYFSGIILPQDHFMLGTVTMVLLSSLISQIDNQIRDYNADKKTKTNNSVQRLGIHNASSLNRILKALFFTFSMAVCYFFNLYLTILLILLNISLYYFVNPKKYRHILEFANIWIIVLFLEHSMAYFSYQEQLLISFWIIVMGSVAIRRVKSINLFEDDDQTKSHIYHNT